MFARNPCLNINYAYDDALSPERSSANPQQATPIKTKAIALVLTQLLIPKQCALIQLKCYLSRWQQTVARMRAAALTRDKEIENVELREENELHKTREALLGDILVLQQKQQAEHQQKHQERDSLAKEIAELRMRNKMMSASLTKKAASEQQKERERQREHQRLEAELRRAKREVRELMAQKTTTSQARSKGACGDSRGETTDAPSVPFVSSTVEPGDENNSSCKRYMYNSSDENNSSCLNVPARRGSLREGPKQRPLGSVTSGLTQGLLAAFSSPRSKEKSTSTPASVAGILQPKQPGMAPLLHGMALTVPVGDAKDRSLGYKGMVDQEGRAHGKGVWVWAEGDKYEGDWVHGKRQGYGKYWLVDGDMYEGGFRKCKKHGDGHYIWKNGAWYKGQWKHNLMHGQASIYIVYIKCVCVLYIRCTNHSISAHRESNTGRVGIGSKVRSATTSRTEAPFTTQMGGRKSASTTARTGSSRV
jgi:hypothetical protein